MASLVLETEVRAPVGRCFDLAHDIDLHRRSMEAFQERAIAGVISGPIGPGQEVTWRARHFGAWWSLTSRIVDVVLLRPLGDEHPQEYVGDLARAHQGEDDEDDPD